LGGTLVGVGVGLGVGANPLAALAGAFMLTGAVILLITGLVVIGVAQGRLARLDAESAKDAQ
jgi:hypothetical protein